MTTVCIVGSLSLVLLVWLFGCVQALIVARKNLELMITRRIKGAEYDDRVEFVLWGRSAQAYIDLALSPLLVMPYLGMYIKK